MSIVIDIDHNATLERYGLSDNNPMLRRYLAARVQARADKFVPMRQGPLKNTYAIAPDGSSVTYLMSYAKRQYENERYTHLPGRTHHWIDTMMQAEGSAVEADIRAWIAERGRNV